MGTDRAQLQGRTESALGPIWGVEREVGLAAKLLRPQVVHTPTGDGTALGVRAYGLLLRACSIAGRPPTPPSRHIQPKHRRCFLNAGRWSRRQAAVGPRSSAWSTREVVFPLSTGGRIK